MKRLLFYAAVILSLSVVTATLMGASATYPTANQVTLKNMDLYLAQAYTVASDGGREVRRVAACGRCPPLRPSWPAPSP